MKDAKKWGIFNKKSITYNTVSSVIGPQMKKPADIPIDAGTSHSNTLKRKFWNMRQTILPAAVKIQILNVKHLMMSTLHMTQKQDI